MSRFQITAMLLMVFGCASAGEVGNYPNAGVLTGTERMLADQAGISVDITPTQLEQYLFPNGYLPNSLMPVLTGDCTTTTGSFAITCTKSNGNVFSSLATAPTASAIVSLFSSCGGTDYLGADGQCHVPAGGGTVTSIIVTVPAYLIASGNPVTSAGTIAISGATLSAGEFLASPPSTAGPLSPRAIVNSDLPLISLNTGVMGVTPAANGGTGESGTINGIAKANGTAAFTMALSNDVINLWTGSCSSLTYLRGDGSCASPAGSGTVNSVAFTASSLFTVTGSPITSAGTINLAFASNTANLFLATPNGASGSPILRSIVSADLPLINLASSTAGGVTGNLGISHFNGGINASANTFWRGDGTFAVAPGSISSIGLTAPSVFAVGNSPLTGPGTLALTFATGQGANQVLASPSGNTGPVGLRSLVAADIPPISLTNGVFNILPASLGGSGEAGILTGLIYANGTNPFTTATVGNIVGLFGNSCSAATFLRGDGTCNTVGTGTVTSIAITTPSYLTVQGSPISTSGTIAIVGTSEPASYVLAAPNGSAGSLAPRLLVANDIPTLPFSNLSGTLLAAQEPAHTGDAINTAGSLSLKVVGVNGLTIPVSASVVGTNSLGQLVAETITGTGNNVLQTNPSIINANLNTPSAINLANATNLSLTAGVTGILPVGNGGLGTTGLTGILYANGASAASIATSGNVIGLWSGTCSSLNYLRGDGTCAAPAGAGTVTSVGLSVPFWLTVSGSPITGSGTFNVTGTTLSGNLVVASPNGASGAAAPRSLVLADLPNASTLFVTVTSNTTLSPTNTSVLVNASSGPITITLPTAVGDNHLYYVKKIDSSSNAVTVNTTNSQTIDTQSTSGVQNQFSSITFKSDSNNWWII